MTSELPAHAGYDIASENPTMLGMTPLEDWAGPTYGQLVAPIPAPRLVVTTMKRMPIAAPAIAVAASLVSAAGATLVQPKLGPWMVASLVTALLGFKVGKTGFGEHTPTR